MTIQIKFYHPQTVVDSYGNGGRMSDNLIPMATAHSVFPKATDLQRSMGATTYRKLFVKAESAEGWPLANAMIYLRAPTAADDRILLASGTPTDTQQDATAYARFYGVGILHTNAAPGDPSISVLVEAAADNIFRNGDTVVISNQDTPDSAGATEILTLDSTGGATWAGNVATLTFADGQVVNNAYSAGAAFVSSAFCPGTIAASVDDASTITATGAFDSSRIELDSIGTFGQDWKLTFVSSTTYAVTGGDIGPVGVGSITADFAIYNSTFSRPIFSIPVAAWTRPTWQAGDSVLFSTTAAACSVWAIRIIPPFCGSLSAGVLDIWASGDTP